MKILNKLYRGLTFNSWLVRPQKMKFTAKASRFAAQIEISCRLSDLYSYTIFRKWTKNFAKFGQNLCFMVPGKAYWPFVPVWPFYWAKPSWLASWNSAETLQGFAAWIRGFGWCFGSTRLYFELFSWQCWWKCVQTFTAEFLCQYFCKSPLLATNFTL